MTGFQIGDRAIPNMYLVPFILGGWLFGVFIACAAIIVCGARGCRLLLQFLVPLILPPVVAFVGGAISCPIMAQYGEALDRERRELFEASQAKYQALYEQLRGDPGLAFREKWYQGDLERRRAFGDSLQDPTVPYTLDQLKGFYAEAPATRGGIFAHPACDGAFLSEHFEEAYERAHSIDHGRLAAIVSNRNTPRELLERVAASKTLPWGAVEPARRTLGQTSY